MDPFKLLMSAFKRLTTAITSPFRMMIVRIQRLFNINILTAKLISPLTKKVKSLLTLRPKAKEDYVSIGRFWVFKKLFLTLVLVLCAGVFLYFTMFAPPLPTKPPAPAAVKTNVDFSYDDMKVSSFTGVANILAADGKVVYTGDVDKGVCKGNGVLYSRDGAKLYEGGFELNKYQGKGVQYYPDGAVRYEGEFAQNLYNGAGKMYDSKGVLMYEGTFKDGLYDGEGKEFSESGALVYEGGFSQGKFHGEGIRYNPDGGINYEGGFFQGMAQGDGTLYSAAGKAIYTGAMYNDAINYRSLVNSTLAEVEAAFTETPRVFYADKDSCFVFEEAGVILSADCRVQVDIWEKPKTQEEEASEYYFMPSELSSDANQQLAAAPVQNSVEFLGSMQKQAEPFGIQPLGLASAESNILPTIWFIPDSGNAESQPTPPESLNPEPVAPPPQATKAPEQLHQPEAGEAQPEATPSTENNTSPAVQPTPAPAENPLPDFVEKNISLYFEIDKNVWQSEAELDKSKVLIKKVTVMKPQGEFVIPKEPGFDDNLPPSIEDCVAIDYARQNQPTAFSNVLFEMDKQNKLFVHLKNISYAERIVQKSYDVDGMTFRCCYPLDQRDKMMYYSIEK